MSNWSYIKGEITFTFISSNTPMFNSKILDDIIKHAIFTGSERNASVDVIYNASNKVFNIAIYGHLRDRYETDTVKEFSKWISYIKKYYNKYVFLDVNYMQIGWEKPLGLLVIDNKRVTNIEFDSNDFIDIETW